MPGRFPAPIPETLEKGLWTRHLGTAIKRWMMSIQAAVGGLEGTPITPTTIRAGVDAYPGDSQAAAQSDHVHPIDTAAPSAPVGFGGTPAEGSSPAVLRSDAGLIMEAGESDGDLLVWDAGGDTWVSTPTADAIETATLAAMQRTETLIVDMVVELKTITEILRRGLNVREDPKLVRRNYERDTNAMLQELRTIAYYLYVGLNVPVEPDQPRT